MASNRKLSAPRAALGRAVRRIGGATRADVNRLEADVNRLEAQLSVLREREDQLARELEDIVRRVAIGPVSRFIEQAPPHRRPLVSVVTPTLERPERLSCAIASVRAQSYERWELLVIEDGGDESSRAMVEEIADDRVSWSHIPHGGSSAARNHALQRARGELVAYLDDDNLMDPEWLRAVVWAFEQRPDVDVVYGAWVVDDPLRLQQRAAGALPSLFFNPWDGEVLRERNLVDVSALAHRRPLPGAWFDEELRMLEDWDLLVRVTQEKPALALPVIACYYTTDAPGRSSSGTTAAQEGAVVSERARRGVTNSDAPLPQTEAIVHRELGRPPFGRLGNQLWQIAGTLGIAARFGKRAWFPEWSYRPHFSIPDEYFDPTPMYCEDATRFASNIAPSYRPYLQDPGLWREITSTVRACFAPSAATSAELEARFGDFLALPAKTAVHIRRGDYVPQPDYFPVKSETYLRAALACVPRTNLVIFSDDVPWCRANLSWAEPAMFMTENADYEDLLLMASCDHHVIANSSFSWWGAFLSENPSPIFPRQWYGPRFDEIFPGADPSVMFLDGWIGIDG